MTTKRKQYSAQEKVRILRLHLLEKVPVSELCQEHGIHPTVFYRWQKELFENGSLAFENRSAGRGRQRSSEAERIAALEAKLARKHEVLSELMEEHIQLKKDLGESSR